MRKQIRKNRFIRGVLLAAFLFGIGQAQAAVDGASITPVGLHTTGIRYWNGTPHFCNMLNMADRNWMMGTLYTTGDGIDYIQTSWDMVYSELNPALVNANGYPIAMPSGTYIQKDPTDKTRNGTVQAVPTDGILFSCPGSNGDEAARETYQGRYVLSWTGDADIRVPSKEMDYISGDAETGVISNGTRIYKTRTNQIPGGAFVAIYGLGNSPITDIRLSMPDPADPWNQSLETGTFHPTFLDRIADRDWAYIRIGNMINTVHDNPQIDWVDRRKPTHCFQEGVINMRAAAPEDYLIWTDSGGEERYPKFNNRTGMSFEYMVELCNSTGKDLWLSTPHRVTDDFLHKLAQLIQYGSDGINPYTGSGGSNPTPSLPLYPALDPSIQIYLEFSNEVWQNPTDLYPQTICAKVDADHQGISVPQVNARQFSRVWNIFETHLGEDRIYRVAANRAGGRYVHEFMDEFYDNSALLKPEIISPATYFGNNIQQWVFDTYPALPSDPEDVYWTDPAGFGLAATNTFNKWKDLIFSEALYKAGNGPDALDLQGGFDEEIHEIALERGLEIVAYEGGPSIYTAGMIKIVNGEETSVYDPGTTLFMNEINRHDGFVELYRIHMNQGLERGLRTHCLFTLMGKYSRHGQWGHLEYLMQDPDTSPKYTFIKNWFDLASTLNHIDHPVGSQPSFTTDTFLPLFAVGTYQSVTIGVDHSAVSMKLIGALLPAGLTFDLTSRTLSGTPTETGKGYLYLMVEDTDGDPTWKTFEWFVLNEGDLGPYAAQATLDFNDIAMGYTDPPILEFSEEGYRVEGFDGQGEPYPLVGVGTAKGFENSCVAAASGGGTVRVSRMNPDEIFLLEGFEYGPAAGSGDQNMKVTVYFNTGDSLVIYDHLSSSSQIPLAQEVCSWPGLSSVEFQYQQLANETWATCVLDNIQLKHEPVAGTSRGIEIITPAEKEP